MAKTIPLKGIRRMIASKMSASLQEAAQLSYFADFDATELIKRRARVNENSPIKIGYEDFFAEALGAVLPNHPEHNGRVTSEGAELSNSVHISVAVALSSGLVAPTMFGVETKSLIEISTARRDVMERARTGKLTVHEMTAGTFTISNLGLTRVRHFTPILNAPQLAMLGIGKIEKRPAVIEGQIEIRPMIGLSLTADHRFIDGDPSGRFLTSLCEYLESRHQ